MKVIQANCRVQFTAEDIAFLLAVLAKRPGQRISLTELLTDAESRDAILDDDAVYEALLNAHGCLPVSPHLYFYVLVRRGLARLDISSRPVADYLAEMLTEFSHADRLRCTLPPDPQPLEYFVEMLAALPRVDDVTRFCLRTHIGNRSLFYSGLLAEHMHFRSEHRGCPNARYYQALGQASFRVARDHRLAQRYELTAIFDILAETFGQACQALRQLADQVFLFSGPGADLDRLLQKHLAPVRG